MYMILGTHRLHIRSANVSSKPSRNGGGPIAPNITLVTSVVNDKGTWSCAQIF